MVLEELLEELGEEGLAMYTMEDFKRDYMKKNFPRLTPEEQREVLEMLPLENRLAGLSVEQIRQYLDRLTAGLPTAPPRPRRKKPRGNGSAGTRARKKKS